MTKVIMITLDGLQYDVSVASMGYMNHLVEKSKASLYKVESELPSLSRPLYEVLLTGTPAIDNGITSNDVIRLSNQESIFHLAKSNGLRTAAAAYHWVSELYNQAPFNMKRDREQHNEKKPIQHGMFYFDDAYPDSHLFMDAEYLRSTYDPDFLYIHSMGIDNAGHQFGSESKEYRGKAYEADNILSLLIPDWLGKGYQIIVTSDHGMNSDGHHGGTSSAERSVPLYILSDKCNYNVYADTIPQLAIAPMVCKLLGINRSSVMNSLAIPGFK